MAEDDAFTRFTGYTPKPAAIPAEGDDAFSRFTGYKPGASFVTVEPDKMQPDLLVRRNADKTGPVDVVDPGQGKVVKSFSPQEWEQRQKDIEQPRYGSVAQGWVSGIPIAGPALVEGSKKAAAAVRALSNGTSYADERHAVDAIDNQLQKQHPVWNEAGKLGGAASTYGLAASVPGVAPYLGMGTAPLGDSIAAGALSGAPIGWADSYVRGENPLTGAAGGFAGGMFGPVAGKVIGTAGEHAANDLTRAYNRVVNPVDLAGVGLARPAANMLLPMLEADNPQRVRQALTGLGPDATLADAGPGLRALTGGLAAKPDARQPIEDFFKGRAAGTTGRLQGELNAQLGPAEDPQVVTNNIRAYRGAQDAATYEAVHNAAPPVDVSAAVGTIDRHLATATGNQRRALEKWRNELVAAPASVAPDGTPIPEQYHDNSRVLHNLRQDIDTDINYGNPGLGIPAGALSREQGSVGAVRRAVDSALKDQVPGMREADAVSAALARRAEAVQNGTQLLDSGKTTVPPDTYAATRQGMPIGEQLAENKGIRGELGRLTGVKRNDLVALNSALQGEGGWNTDKLRTAFGNEPVNRILGAVARENAFAETTNKTLHNSETQPRAEAAKLLDEQNPERPNLRYANLTGLALQAGRSAVVNPILDALLDHNRAQYFPQLARALTAQGVPRDEIVNRLMQMSAQNQLASSVAPAAGRAAKTIANPLMRAGLQSSNWQ